MKTAIVILNWNGKKFLEQFLPGLLASVSGDARVIVADNASDDGSMEMMKEKFPDVSTMVFSRNWGFTGGYNRALLGLKAEYFVLINSDIEVSRGWLEPLVEWMDSHPRCGMCAPKLHSWQKKDMFEYAGAAGGYIDRYGYPFCRGRIMKLVEKDEGQYDTEGPVFWASGACLMVRADLYRELGGLDERFFAHMEEIDLCWRAQLAGYQVNVVPRSTVWHIGGGTLPNDSPWKLYLNYRNNLLMLRNNLAKTEALQLHRQGKKRKACAEEGLRRARRRIFTRMVMDGLSAVTYLLCFKMDCFKAVLKAHRDVRRYRTEETVEDIMTYLRNDGKKAVVRGIYGKWMVPEALIYGKRMFARSAIYFEKVGKED